MNCFDEYYKSQAGNGIAGFSGVKYQKGFGFFGRLLSGAVIPFLRFLGKNALKVGANIGKDLADSEDFSLNNIKEKGRARFKEGVSDMFLRGSEKLLTGKGIKKKESKKEAKKKVIKDKRAKKSKPKNIKSVKPKKGKKKNKSKKKECFLK